MAVNQRNLFSGRTEFRESDYKFARTCTGYYPERADRRDIFTGRCALAIIIVLLVLYAVGINL